VRVEEKIIDISCNINLLMESLENKLGTFLEVGGSKLQV
jgi:hypothetical protein